MALGISLINATESALEVEATGFSSAVTTINWYIDDAYDGSVSRGSSSWPGYTFTGLADDTTYTIKAAFYQSGTLLDKVERNFTTEASSLISETFYAKLILDGNGGKNGTSSTWTYTNWGASWDGYCDIDISFNGYGFTRAGYSLAGWSERSNATSADYDVNDTYTIRSYSTNESRPETETLYAVWTSGRPNNWYWDSTVAAGRAVPTTQISTGVYQAVYLTADEWERFIDRILEFAEYLGVSLSQYTINQSSATAGNPMLASQAQAAVDLLTDLDPPTSPPALGNFITARFVNGLANSLNSIP